MKTIYILLIAMFLCANGAAQLQKGTILLEGDIRFWGTDYSEEYDPYYNYSLHDYNHKSSAIELNPKFGFFASESLVLGIGMSYRLEKRSLEYQSSSNNNTWTGERDDKEYLFQLNPYLTKYSKLGEKIYFTSTINLYAGLGKSRSVNENFEKETSICELQISARPGITYFISDNWAL